MHIIHRAIPLPYLEPQIKVLVNQYYLIIMLFVKSTTADSKGGKRQISFFLLRSCWKARDQRANRQKSEGEEFESKNQKRERRRSTKDTLKVSVCSQGSFDPSIKSRRRGSLRRDSFKWSMNRKPLFHFHKSTTKEAEETISVNTRRPSLITRVRRRLSSIKKSHSEGGNDRQSLLMKEFAAMSEICKEVELKVF